MTTTRSRHSLAVRLRVLAALIAIVWAVLPAPSSASAAGRSKSDRAASAAFTVPGTNGYSLNVKSERGTVTIVAANRRPPVTTFASNGSLRSANTGDVAASTYFAFGSGANPSEIDAPLGRLGRISVSFHPSGRVHAIELKRRSAGQDCAAPQKLVRHLGVFSGTIRFRGENGYTRVTARRARGSVGTPLAPSCGSASQIAAGESAAQEPSAIAEATLSALNKRNGAQFEAATASGGVDYSAFSAEPLGVNLIVSRSAHAIAPRTSFAFDGSLSSAKIKPPAPFSGRAGYDLGQGRYAPTWAGSLSVTFPGASMPLTGPNFKATLAPGY